MGTKDWLKRLNLYIFEMNVVNFWLAYQGITRTADTQSAFHNYMDVDMIDNTYNRFMIQRADVRKWIIFDSDDDYFNEKKPLFVRISGAPRCGFSLHVTPTKKSSKKRDCTDNQCLIQGE